MLKTINKTYILLYGATYFILAAFLFVSDRYDMILGLLDSIIVQSTYLGRVIVDFLSMTHFSLLDSICIILDNITIFELIIILLIGYYYKKLNHPIFYVILVANIVILSVCIMFAINSLSLLQAYFYVKIIAIMLIVDFVILLFAVTGCYKWLLKD